MSANAAGILMARLLESVTTTYQRLGSAVLRVPPLTDATVLSPAGGGCGSAVAVPRHLYGP